MHHGGSRASGLGNFWGTDEHIVTEPGGGVVRARSVKPNVEQWDRELFDGIAGWPSEPMARRKPGNDQPRVDTETPRPPAPRQDPVPAAPVRRMMIRKEDVTRYGPTELRQSKGRPLSGKAKDSQASKGPLSGKHRTIGQAEDRCQASKGFAKACKGLAKALQRLAKEGLQRPCKGLAKALQRPAKVL